MTTTTAAPEPQLAPASAIPAFARGPVLTIATAVALVMFLLSSRYGYFGDELYFLSAGKRLDWGYADQPPLLPLLALAMDSIAPGSVTMLRLPATLATAAGAVFTALIARELGGGRRAQTLGAAASALCAHFLATGHNLATSTIDPFLWTVLLWVVVRWVRTRNDVLLLWAGVVTGVALNVKLLVLAFWAVAGVCALVVGPRELPRRPMLWAGALVSVVALVPTIIWQTANGWPQFGMGQAISAEVDQGWGGRLNLVPGMVQGAGLVVGSVLLLYGLWQLLRSEELRAYRFLGWTVLGLVLIFTITNGRFYYVSGIYAVCWAAGAVAVERGQPSKWWRWVPTWPVFVLSAIITLPTALPIYPMSWLRDHPQFPRPPYSVEEVGWPEMAASVAETYDRLPDSMRDRTAIVTAKYWQASAIDRFGAEHGLTEVYSGNRGFGYFGQPGDDKDIVMFVAWDPSLIEEHFTDVHKIGLIDNGLGIGNISQRQPIWLATGPKEPWQTLWPKFRNLWV
ncbi:glycosyl transferase, family 39 [Amycolatopsis antarctica]|uniref:Glycosyl transferase, family 39 n=1 Tax=Amycolatopsis antarctica TaxID=1854586 RepID=A0A263D163_9PSEU|nr:glycosyltransferase family 39 protein [Amycolatopsis antarctica]OZM72172.1 glycosyl transferase, family 39 [Amycolatopsis antarctica]